MAAVTPPTTPALPGSPTSPSPTTGATDVSTSAALSWTAIGASSYDLRLDTSNPPATVVGSNLTAVSYRPPLSAGTRYYWQVVARNTAGAAVGPVWSFTTASTSTTALPAPWTSEDIGLVGVSGSATHANGTFTVGGGGVDIWGTADAFQYVSQPLIGDGEIVARVTALQNTHVNAKAGLMMRGPLTASAQHVMINAAVDGSIELISRSGAGSAARLIAVDTQPRPAWLKLTRVGSTVTASVSSNGQAWSVVGSTSVSGLAYSGLVVTSADTSKRNVSTFDSVTVTLPPVPPPTTPSLPVEPASPNPVTGATGVTTSTRLTWSATGASTYDIKLGGSNPPGTVVASNLTAASYLPTLAAGTRYFWQVVARNSAGSTAGPVWSFTTTSAPPTTGLPVPWTSQDIGNVGVSGSATYANGVFTVAGGGIDIWGTADAFQYVFQPLDGDGEIIARVTSLANTALNRKAGVMMRGGLSASAQHVMINAATDGSIEFIRRSSAGSAATFIAGSAQSLPAWLKLTRVGSTVTGSVSSDGGSWSVVGSTNVSGLAYTGLVVTSADLSERNVSTFDSVTVSSGDDTPSATGDIVIYASDLAQTALHGSWQKASSSSSPNGVKLTTRNDGAPRADSPLASPTDYVDVNFDAPAGTPYTVWLRLAASNNDRANDSVWVQFSDARAGGAAIYPAGSASGLLVTLATDGSGDSLNGWGWQNAAFWLTQQPTVSFAGSGRHTLRVQVREDGVQLDQIVLSPVNYLTQSPGQVSGDLTIVPK